MTFALIFNKPFDSLISKFFLNHHHHPTQCIPLIEKLWIGSGEGRTVAIHTHKGECDQRSPPARENNINIFTMDKTQNKSVAHDRQIFQDGSMLKSGCNTYSLHICG